MGFRDDRDAMRARLDALEGELDDLKRENAALRRRDRLEVGPLAWLLGAPPHLRVERVVEGELVEATHEVLVEEARARFGALGEVTRVGRSFAWSLGPPASTRVVEVSAAPHRGETRIRVAEHLGNLVGRLFGGVVGGVGGLGLGFVVPLSFALRFPAGLLPFLVVGWVGAVYALVRTAFRSTAQRRQAELTACADELANLTVDRRDGGVGRVRVEAEARALAEDGARVGEPDHVAARRRRS